MLYIDILMTFEDLQISKLIIEQGMDRLVE